MELQPNNPSPSSAAEKVNEGLYLAGKNALDNQNYREAIKQLKELQSRDAKYRDASKLLEKAMNLALEDEKRHQYEAGRLNLNQGNWPEAIKQFEALLQLDPDYRNTRSLLRQAQARQFLFKKRWIFAGIGVVLLLGLCAGASLIGSWFVFPKSAPEIPPTQIALITDTLTPIPPTSELSTATPSPLPLTTPPPATLTPTFTPLPSPTELPPPTDTPAQTQNTPASLGSLPNISESKQEASDTQTQPTSTSTDTPTAVIPTTESITVTPSPSDTPLPTPTLPHTLPSLSGKIAIPVFEGDTYNIYLASADSNWTPKLLFEKASQPAFSKNGLSMVLRSWSHKDWAQSIIYLPNYSDVTGFHSMTKLVEDAHPSLNSRNEEILFQTRPQNSQGENMPPLIIRFNINADIEDKNSRVDLGEGEKPAWLGDDKIVFFHGAGLHVMDKDNNNRQLLLSTNDKTAIAVASDNDRVAIALQKEGRWQIFTLAVSQGQESLAQLTKDSDADKYLPAWSPDGNYIAFVSNSGGNWAVWVMQADGSEPRELFKLPGSIDGTVTADGTESRTTFGWWEERLSWAP